MPAFLVARRVANTSLFFAATPTRLSLAKTSRSSYQQGRLFSTTRHSYAASTPPSSSSSSTSSVKRKLLGDEAIIPCRSILPLSVVNHPRIQAALPFLGNVAYIGIASGFLMTDMLQLRLLLTVGYTGLVAYHILRPVPLRIPMRWSAVFVLVNAGAAALLWIDQYGFMAPLTKEEERLYQDHFSALTRGQFHQLLSLSTRVELQDKTVLTEEGVPCPHLYFLEQGHALVYHHKDSTAEIESGGFVNDVAFQRGEKQGDDAGAYGTVVVVASEQHKCTALVWDHTELRQLLKRNKTMEQNFKYILSDHLVKSLLRQRKAAHLRQQSAATQGFQ